jgi:hypothetical protein
MMDNLSNARANLAAKTATKKRKNTARAENIQRSAWKANDSRYMKNTRTPGGYGYTTDRMPSPGTKPLGPVQL